MKSIPAASTIEQVFHPDVSTTAAAVGNRGVNVVATTTLILYFEDAAATLAMPYLETDEVTAGTHVCVDHLAPAQTGKPITVRAQLLRQQGRRLEFSMEARQEQALVMKGEHHRAVADSSRFAGEPASSSRRLDFWFDFHSPWCYFASHRIADLAHRHRLELSWKPVHLANLMQANGFELVYGNQFVMAAFRLVSVNKDWVSDFKAVSDYLDWVEKRYKKLKRQDRIKSSFRSAMFKFLDVTGTRGLARRIYRRFK